MGKRGHGFPQIAAGHLIIQAGFSSCHTVILAVVREIGNGLDQQLVLAGNHPLIIDSGCLSDHHARIFRTEIPFDGFDVALPLAADDCGHRLRRSNAGIGNAGLEGEAGAARYCSLLTFPKWRRLVFCVRFEKSSGEDTAVPLDASTTVMRTPSLPEFQKLLLVP